ncbi:MAG: S8 family serine peptidase [Candidatus Woesearchaeota archaeon]|nr:S8 family serine peptidase [Candidatus Woesearchaeota archaeon]
MFSSSSSIFAKEKSMNEFNGIELKTKFKINEGQLKSFSTDSENKNEYYLIQFNSKLNEKTKLELEKDGVIFYDYIPDNSYLVKFDSQKKSKILSSKDINWYGKYLSEYKIDKKINLSNNELIEVLVNPHKDIDLVLLKSTLKNNDAVLEILGDTKFLILINVSNIQDIANLNEVKYIEKYSKPELFNINARVTTNVNFIWDNLGLYGEGQKIAIADSGLDTGVNDASMHDDFEGRIIGITDLWGAGPDDDSSHGTHVAGTVLGDGNLSGSNPSLDDYKTSNAGVAPKAKVYSQAFEDTGLALEGVPADLFDLFNPMNSIDIKTHTNSWGNTACNGIYNINSVSSDQFMWDNQDFTILFAAGNDGPTPSTMACPATAKNVITIGASNTSGAFAIAEFSSRGPTNDSRIKPDLVAPGAMVFSTLSQIVYPGIYYGGFGGTSMATPHVAGVVLLMREHLNSTKGISNPSSSLIKALLINGADDITGTRPDNDQGWGQVNLKNSISPSQPGKIFFYDNTTGFLIESNYTYDFEIKDDSLPLRITLVWTDYPSTEIATENLVNDIDLILNTPDGTIYFGNDFSAPFNNEKDDINNVEGIEILIPQIGNYSLNVSAFNIITGPQTYSLVMSYAQSSPKILKIDSPENIIYNTSRINFNITLDDIGLVEFSLDDGITNITMQTLDDIEFNYTLSNIPDGNYNVTFYAKNLSNVLSDTRKQAFIVDTIKPTITVNSPNSFKYSSLYIIFNITSNEFSQMWFSVDNGTTNTSMQTIDNLSFTYNFSIQNNNNYSIIFYAQDVVGNLNQTQKINFSVDSKSPKISINSPQNINYSNINSTILNITLDEIGLAWFSTNNGITNTSMQNLDSLTFTYNLTGLIDGIYNLIFYANDTIGNLNSTSIQFRIDNGILNMSIDSFSNNSQINTSKLSIYFNATTNKELSKITYTINSFTYDIFDKYSLNYIETDLDLIEYGNQNISFYIEDLFGNSKTLIYNLNIISDLSGVINDTDGDGVNNSIDNILGNETNIQTNLNDLTLEVNNSINLTKIFNTTYNVSIKENNSIVVEFLNNFSSNKLDFSNVTIKKDNSSNLSKLLLRGINLESTKTKTLYLDLIGNTTKDNSLCLKDEVVYDFSQITSTCSGSSETYIYEIPYSENGYIVTYTNSTNRTVKIQGLSHSAITQSCTEDWSDVDWETTCTSDSQTGTTIDNNNCGTTFTKPVTTQSCTSPVDNEEEEESNTASSSTDDGDDEYIITTDDDDEDEEEIINNTIEGLRSTIKNSYSFSVGRTGGINDGFKGVEKIKIKDKIWLRTLIEFEHDFSDSELDLSKFDFEYSQTNKSYIIVKGLDLGTKTKKVRIKALDNTNKICIKDEEVNSIEEISLTCDSVNEYLVNCDSIQTNEGYTCIIDEEYYYVLGLKHSAVLEYVEPEKSISEVVTIDETSNNLDSSNIVLSDSLSSNSKISILKISLYAFIGIFLSIIGILIILRISKNGEDESDDESKMTESRVLNHVDPNNPKAKKAFFKNESKDNLKGEKILISNYKQAKMDIDKITTKTKKKFVDNDSFSDIHGYKSAKEYVKSHKESHDKKVLYESLISSKYSKDIIDQVFKEEFVDDDNQK